MEWGKGNNLFPQSAKGRTLHLLQHFFIYLILSNPAIVPIELGKYERVKYKK